MPPRRTTPRSYARARELRKILAPAEATLWKCLRGNRLAGVSFRRQHAIGPYIVDFCTPRWKLIVEIDGDAHSEQHEYDEQRTTYLQSRGYRVMRFWNSDVMRDINAVIRIIEDKIREE